MQVKASFETLSGSTPSLLGSGQVAVSTWSHIAAVYDGVSVRTYVNGQQASNTPYPNGRLKPSVAPLTIGAVGGANFFGGRIDEVRFSATSPRFPSDRNGNVVCGFTTARSGNLGGWVNAAALCQSACGNPYAHMCTADEMARSWQFGAITPSGGAWVTSVRAIANATGGTGGTFAGRSDLFSGYAGCCAWNTGTFAVTSISFPSPVSTTMLSNCSGWTGSGLGQAVDASDFIIADCSTTRPVACCD